MQSSYWSKVLQRRMGRRRAIAATGATAAAAAFLVACGGDDDTSSPSGTGATGGSTGSGGGSTGGTGGSTGGSTSSLVSKPVNTMAQAKVGGRFVSATNREPSHFDGKAQGQVQLNTFNQLAYEALVHNIPGEGAPSTWTEVGPELAESWESSPDNLTLTFKLRSGVKWQNRPPINGREFDAEDVVATWERYESAETPNNKFTNSNNLNPEAPIIGMTAIDPQTLEIKLARPATYIFQRLSTMITGELGSVYPKEAGDTFDPEKDQIGTGPWMLERFTPSVELVYTRNPDYWGDVYLDELQFPVIPEYSTRLAQFRTGALSTAVVTPEDMIPTKNDVPALTMNQITLATNSTGNVMRFGWLPINGKPSPFLDIRLRQALHLAVNRDEFIDAFSNVSAFEAEGVPVNTYYYTTQGYVPDLTLDPRDAGTFGENARFYEYNMEEAKKLFDAAHSAYGGSYPEIRSHAVATVFGPNYTAESEAMDGYARELGLNIVNTQLDYNTDYLPNFVTKQGQFEGILYGIGAVTSGDMTDYYLWRYYSKTGATSGQLGYGGPDGSLGDGSGDPEADALIQRATQEFDAEARIEIFHELQRYLTGKAYMVPRPGFADTFALSWPAISSFGYFQNDSRVNLDASLPFNPMQMWYDDTKPHG